ncbi:MAG: hypothetical protein FWG66_14385 [Spirochaetes bacterium]|nr:hypothetical protein [Spirochaetota bacterium]
MPIEQTTTAPTFESVWALVKEVAQAQKENERIWEKHLKEAAEARKEAAERLAERQKEAAERQKEAVERRKKNAERRAERQKEADERRKKAAEIEKKRSKELNRKIGKLTNLFGDFTLGMVAPKLRKKFAKFGLDFHTSGLNVVVHNKTDDSSLEIDVYLQNGDKAMLVEVKTKLTVDRIKKHVERLEKMRRSADVRGDKRTFLGAVAGFSIEGEVRDTALAEGFYLIEPDGENFNITEPFGKPKEW